MSEVLKTAAAVRAALAVPGAYLVRDDRFSAPWAYSVVCEGKRTRCQKTAADSLTWMSAKNRVEFVGRTTLDLFYVLPGNAAGAEAAAAERKRP